MRILLVMALVAAPSFVTAQPKEAEIPQLDIYALCKTAGNFQGRQLCNDLERGAYNELNRMWPLASEATREKALLKSSVALSWNNYYEVLLHYLDTALIVEGVPHQRPLNKPRLCCGLIE